MDPHMFKDAYIIFYHLLWKFNFPAPYPALKARQAITIHLFDVVRTVIYGCLLRIPL